MAVDSLTRVAATPRIGFRGFQQLAFFASASPLDSAESPSRLTKWRANH